MDLLLEIDSQFYGPFVTSYKKGEKELIFKMTEYHLWNHGGKPTLLQENFKDPEKDWIPTESV